MPESLQDAPILILGQGLAGSCLALELSGRGVPFRVVDFPGLSNASKVAAGILNPLIFRYYTLSWRAEKYLEFSKEYYMRFGEVFQLDVLHKVPLLRVFGQNEDRIWEDKAHVHPFSKFMTQQVLTSMQGLALSFGAGLVNAAGWVDTTAFVDKVRDLLLKKGALDEREWQYDQIEEYRDKILYDGEEFRCVVFCEGYRATQNPFLSIVPFRPVKGDVVTLRIPGFHSDYILNKNIFLVPIGADIFRLGSTYVWDFDSQTPDPAGLEKLLSGLHSIIPLEVEVMQHAAGIRPAVADRRPVVGVVPGHQRIYVFNGLGSRGGLLAPPLARYLSLLMMGESAVDEEISPERFLSENS